MGASALGSDGVEHVDSLEPVEIGVMRDDPADAVLAHQRNSVRVMKYAAAERAHFGNQLI